MLKSIPECDPCVLRNWLTAKIMREMMPSFWNQTKPGFLIKLKRQIVFAKVNKANFPPILMQTLALSSVWGNERKNTGKKMTLNMFYNASTACLFSDRKFKIRFSRHMLSTLKLVTLLIWLLGMYAISATFCSFLVHLNKRNIDNELFVT